MTVSVDAVAEVVRTGTGSPQTWSHAGAASGVKGVVVGIVHGVSSTDHITAVSYGGVALTRAQRNTDTAAEPGAAELWFLGAGVPQGTQTVSATCGSTTDDIHFVSTTLLGAADLEVVAQGGINENAANPAVTLTYTGRTCMAFAAMYGGGAAPSSFTQNANCTRIHDHDLGAFYSVVIRQTTAGSADFAIGGTASSDDVAFAAIAVSEVVAAQIVAVGQATETDTAQAAGRVKVATLGQPAEADTAQAIAWAPKNRLAGQAQETDTAQAIVRLKLKVIGQIAEADTAGAITVRKMRSVAQAAETDLAQAVARSKSKAIGQVVETDTAQTITRATPPQIVAVGQVTESDTAQAVGRRKTLTLVQVSEANTAQAIARNKTRAVAQAAETDTAQAVGRVKLRIVGQAPQTDTAQPVVRTGNSQAIAVAQTAEVDTAQPLSSRKTVAISWAMEIDLAQSIVRAVAAIVAEKTRAKILPWRTIARVTGAKHHVTSIWHTTASVTRGTTRAVSRASNLTARVISK